MELNKVNDMQNNLRKQARRYVGGNFDTAGKKQFDFLLEEGLKPEHSFLDIGCGNLRAGRYFIEYLDFRHYHGVDHNDWLIKSGIKYELSNEVHQNKKPVLLIDDDFKFFLFHSDFDYALAKSLFTHLTKDRIKQCLTNLYPVLKKDGVFFASISIGRSDNNPSKDNDVGRFRYTVDEIKELDPRWDVEDLGARGTFIQHMLKFTKIID